MLLLLLLVLNLNLIHAGDSEPNKQISNSLGCQAAISSGTLLICFRDDVLDQGLETETKGCSVRLYSLVEKKYIDFDKYDEKQRGQPLLAPMSCLGGGIDAVLNWPIDETKSLKDYIKLAFHNKIVTNLASNENSSLNELVELINKAYNPTEASNGTPPQAAAAPAPFFREKITKNTSVDVFFGTDRQFVATDISKNTFSDKRSLNEQVTLGKVTVSIPLGHKYGHLELPSVFSIRMTPDPDQYVVLKSVTLLNSKSFFSQLTQKIELSDKKDLFVFIHGFNTSFEEAALRTAQMAFDMKFTGAPVFYSWPAETLLRYAIAEKNVEWSLPHLTLFLRDLAKKTGALQIHLIAHSMGNRALTNALNELAHKKMLERQTFQNVILAAPDVDQSLFRQIEKSIKSTTQSLTLYASNGDRALQISARIHKEPRLGQAGDLTLVSPRMDTIDASVVDTSFLGHSYYGDNASVVSDISKLIINGLPITKRPYLTPLALPSGQRFWRLEARPAQL